jgi:predicted SprT family Zn-dependent metalloprotease
VLERVVIRVLVSVLCVAVIFGSAHYAYGREAVRHANLEAEYANINREYFDGQLPTAPVSWAFLTDEMGDTEHGDGSFAIRLDPQQNPDLKTLRETLRHESCHVYVFSGNPQAEDHGPEFQACMSRF